MAAGKDIEKRGHIVGFREEIAKASGNEDSFFTWFDDAANKDKAFIRGILDFSLHVLGPAAPFVSKLEEKTALEIGYGGGRILAAAATVFKKVTGVDIHDQSALVKNELQRRGLTNVELLRTSGDDIPVSSESVDVVYSFIVLQHVEKISVLMNYIKEAKRVMRPGGVAVLYFGRQTWFSFGRSSRALLCFDKMLEHVLLAKGFREIQARVNYVNLVVSMPFLRSVMKKEGFRIVKELTSHRKVPDEACVFGCQHGLVLVKE